ncbi:MAG: copper chaperone PCu(A)C, partial [Paralcaligenes sp.]
MSIRKLFALGAMALLTTAAAYGQQAGTIQIEHPWARATAPQQTMGAGYMAIKNTGAADDALLSITTTAADMAELHQTVTDGSMTKMEAVGKLSIPKGQTVQISPGGYHIMFMHIKAPFKQGDKIPATLTFAKAGEVHVEFQVEALTYQPDNHASHMNMGSGQMNMPHQ